MARKSRKNIEKAVITPPAAKVYYVGAYVRLSAIDRKQKGDSIENQQAIIAAFIAEHPEMVLADTYIDNGTTGQNFERPAFQRMLADFESGKINTCVSKDLSRLGRNAIDTGFYIEKYFPTRGIRYIAINDNYDSNDTHSGGIMVSLKNMVNETYALEVGRKIHATKQMNIKNGLFVGRIPPYGYLKDPADSHKLIPDPYAAPIVKMMFEMVASKQSVRAVLEKLNSDGILPPRKYLNTLGLTTEKEAICNSHWTITVIYSILKNRVYCGDMVQGKGRTNQYVQTTLPKSEWVVTENTHTPIVSREVFDKVQNGWGYSNQATRKSYPKNVFAAKIVCGHCGYGMSRSKCRNGDMSYHCRTRTTHGKDDCIQVSIKENVLKEHVLELLQKQAGVFADLSNCQTSTSAGNELQAEMLKVRQELDRTGGFLKGLYESLIEGDITKNEYAEMKQSYETRISALTAQEEKLRNEIREIFLREAATKKAGDKLGAISLISDLTAEVVDALIEKVLVFEDKHIEVRFKFTDEIVKTEGAGNE